MPFNADLEIKNAGFGKSSSPYSKTDIKIFVNIRQSLTLHYLVTEAIWVLRILTTLYATVEA